MSEKNDRQFNKDAFTFVNSDRVLSDVKLDTKPVGYLKDAWHRFKRNKASVAATVIIAIIALFAIIAPWCTPYKINQADGNYKQVRPKVSANAKGFWDGCYSDDFNDAYYIALQAIGISALDPNGTIMQDWDANYWDRATDFERNPITKVGDSYVTSVNVSGTDVMTTFRKLRVDSYYKVGFVYINGLTYEQYHDVLNWQAKTGKQVVYPIIDDSDAKAFPESNKGDAGEANYWYAMTKTLTPLWPIDENDVSKGYHEMTLDEVKQKGLWALYAKDYERDQNDNPYYYGLNGEKYSCTTVVTADPAKGYAKGDVLFNDDEGNLVYRYDSVNDTYVDVAGNPLKLISEGSNVYFRNTSTNELSGAIIQSRAFHDKDGNPYIVITDENHNVDYLDGNSQLLYHYDAQSGVYTDANGDPLQVAASKNNFFLTNSDDQLIGGVLYQRNAYDVLGNELRVETADNGDLLYYNGNQLVIKYVAASKSYRDSSGKALANSVAAGTSVYFTDNTHSFVGAIVVSPLNGSLADFDHNALIKTVDGDWEYYKLSNGTTKYKHNVSTGVYYDAGDNVLALLDNPDNRYYNVDGKWIALTFEDIYTDIDGTALLVSTDRDTGVTSYKKTNGDTVYRRASKKYYLGDSDELLNLVTASNTNVFFVEEDGTIVSAVLGSGIQSRDKNGNILTVEESATVIKYYKNGNELLYTYNKAKDTYYDAEGYALALAAKGGAYFVNYLDEVVAAIQAPVADKIKMVDITSSGVGGKLKNYRIRVLYYNYYQYLNDHEPVFVLGADSQGYDILVRLAHGCRLSLLLAAAVSLINLVIGAIYGAIEGYYGGVVDMAMERITDILAGVPFIVLVALFRLHLVDTGKVSIVGGLLFAFVVTGWIGTAYATRMQFYRFKGQEYILAARTLGANDGRLMFKHIFPNALGTLITSSVLVIPGVIFSETSLAYLGIVNFNGQNTTSLGTMLSNGQNALGKFPHILLFPALILSLLMISFNLFGNGLRDAFNPSLRGTED